MHSLWADGVGRKGTSLPLHSIAYQWAFQIGVGRGRGAIPPCHAMPCHTSAMNTILLPTTYTIGSNKV